MHTSPNIFPANNEAAQVSEAIAWAKDKVGKKFVRFDLDTKTVRTDITIPACPIAREMKQTNKY